MTEEVANYKRIVLKLSGESFARSGERGISMEEVVHISGQVKQAQELGCEIAVVIGGGNILRGAQFWRRLEEGADDLEGRLPTQLRTGRLRIVTEVREQVHGAAEGPAIQPRGGRLLQL